MILINQKNQVITQMLKTFLQSYAKGLPQSYKKLVSTLQKHPNFFVHYPIVATSNNHPLNIRLHVAPQVKSIPKGANIFMLSSAQSFTNMELIGASIQDKASVDKFFDQNQNKYEVLHNQDMRGLFKILIQIYANQEQIDQGEMPLHYFANLLMNQSSSTQDNTKSMGKYANPVSLGLDFESKKYLNLIKSYHLKNILKSKQNIIQKFYEILCQNFIKTTNFKQFSNLFQLARAQIRQIKQHSSTITTLKKQNSQQKVKIQVLSPILPSLRFSQSSNCILLGKYFTHLRQSYYCLQNVRQLKGGQQLTIPYRKDTNNYQKLMRYGYKSIIQQQNVQNSYPLIINLMDSSIQQVNQIVMKGDIDSKQDILLNYDMKMKNVIKLQYNGEINKEDLKMLRILFGVQKHKQIQADKLQIDKKIYQFINKFVQGQINSQKRLQQQNKQIKDNQNDQILKSLRIIQKGENEILHRYTQSNKKIINK